MAAEFVVPFRKGGKSDGNDSEAITIAACQPTGDAYVRGLLVNGARSALQAALRAAPEKATRLQQWMVALARRCGYQKALVAIANKHARMIWAMLARDETYDPQAWQRHARAATSATTTTATPAMPTPSVVGVP